MAISAISMPVFIKAECQRRIYAVSSQNGQINMTAWVASGQANDADKLAFINALAWVQSMRNACASLIADENAEYFADVHWPDCPGDVVTLASRF